MLSQEVLFKYFAQYNLGIWPMQIVAYVLCLIVLFVAVKKFKYSDQTISAILAFLWLWLGIMFLLPAGAVSPLFYVSAALFIIQGVLFLVSITRPIVSYRVGTDASSLTGLVLIVYATIFYELVGYAVGHTYPQSLTLGAFPCPTTIFTLGLFLCTASKVPKYLLIAPGLFALFGIAGPSLGIVEDLGLFISGILAVAMLVYRDRTLTPKSALRPAA